MPSDTITVVLVKMLTQEIAVAFPSPYTQIQNALQREYRIAFAN